VRFTRGAILLCFVGSLGGCAGTAAFGRTENYESAWPAISGYTASNIDVLVLDKRPYVLSNDKKQSFVGLMRGGFGNPFDIYTTSGLPLSEDIEHAVVKGLQNVGIKSDGISASDGGLRQAKSTNGKLLLITLTEWKDDTFTTPHFEFNILAEVYDEHGMQLGSQQLQGSKAVSSTIEAGRQALSDLLASNSVSKALLN